MRHSGTLHVVRFKHKLCVYKPECSKIIIYIFHFIVMFKNGKILDHYIPLKVYADESPNTKKYLLKLVLINCLFLMVCFFP